MSSRAQSLLTSSGESTPRIAKLIGDAYLKILDDSWGWQEIYANTSKALLNLPSEGGLLDTDAVRNIIGVVNRELEGLDLREETMELCTRLFDTVQMARLLACPLDMHSKSENSTHRI